MNSGALHDFLRNYLYFFMKILHVVSGDLSGGAGRGAYWMHKALLSLGVDSYIFTNSRDLPLENSGRIINAFITDKDKAVNLVKLQCEKTLLKLYRKNKSRIFSTGIFGIDITKLLGYKEYDLVHLHWIGGAFVNIKHLSKIDKPLVWTIRDMWPMTGGCHYAMGCERFIEGCGYCHQLGSKTRYDLSYYVFNRKKKFLPDHMKLVGISDWVSDQAKRSKLFSNYDVQTIHNGIDTDEFSPINKSHARSLLGIYTKKKIILVLAQNINDFYKGFDELLESLSLLSKEKYYCIFVGKIDPKLIDGVEIEWKLLGFLNDLISLRLVYSAADVFVAPSKMEAFGKTIVESMACGTPVVCFDATGPKDIVVHTVNGYKAKSFDAFDLANGIEWVAGHPDYASLASSAIDRAQKKFDIKLIAKRYMNLYEEMLDKR